MAAYFNVDQLEITDPDTMKEKSAGIGATLAKFNAKALVRGGAFETLEGDYRPTRMIVLEFSDMATLKAWYDSEDYAELKAMRHRSSSANIVAVEGL